MIDTNKTDLVVHQEAAEDDSPEPPILIWIDNSPIIVLRQRTARDPMQEILVNAESVPDLVKALRIACKGVEAKRAERGEG